MPVTLLNPDGLPKPEVYRQVAVATGTRHVFVAGQVSRDADDGPVAPGDLAGQVEQCYRNVATALGAAGATFADLVRVTIYVVDWRIEKMAQVAEGMRRVAEELQVPPVPGSLIGVDVLYDSHCLVEVEATAVVG